MQIRKGVKGLAEHKKSKKTADQQKGRKKVKNRKTESLKIRKSRNALKYNVEKKRKL